MKLNSLGPQEGSRHRRRRVGRGTGSGLGKTAGRGHKGQKSRSGGQVKPGFEGGQMPLQMRLPKFGFKSRKGRVTAEVRLSELAHVEDEFVSVESLKKANIIRQNDKRAKLMLSGEVDRAFVFLDVGVTAGARTAIEEAGGRVATPAEVAEARRASIEDAQKRHGGRSINADPKVSEAGVDEGD